MIIVCVSIYPSQASASPQFLAVHSEYSQTVFEHQWGQIEPSNPSNLCQPRESFGCSATKKNRDLQALSFNACRTVSFPKKVRPNIAHLLHTNINIRTATPKTKFRNPESWWLAKVLREVVDYAYMLIFLNLQSGVFRHLLSGYERKSRDAECLQWSFL